MRVHPCVLLELVGIKNRELRDSHTIPRKKYDCQIRFECEMKYEAIGITLIKEPFRNNLPKSGLLLNSPAIEYLL